MGKAIIERAPTKMVGALYCLESSEGPEESYDLAEYGHAVQYDRFHGGVLRLEPVVAVLLIEALDSRFILFSHRNDDVTVMRNILLAYDDTVTVVYAGFDHAVADDIQQEDFTVVVCREVFRQREVFVDVLDCSDRQTGSDLAEYRNMYDGTILFVFLRNDFDGPRLRRIPLYISLLLQFGEVSMDGGA